MIYRNIKRFLKGQSGLTLIELLVSIALLGIVILGSAMVFYQTMVITVESRNHMKAVRNVQNAGYWVSIDGQQISIGIDKDDDASTPGITEVLTLFWDYFYEKSDPVKYEVIYSLDEGTLMRTEIVNDGTPASMILAQDITMFDWDDATGNRVIISSTVGEFRPSSALRAYHIDVRTTQ